MNHEIIKRIIFDQHEIIKKSKIIDRNYTLQDNVNYILVGLRRAGKSTMLYKYVLELVKKGIDWSRIIYINFEDERLLEFNYSNFEDIILVKNELTSEDAYYFFDEIQNIKNWEKFARRMADAQEHVYITGSNSKMLSNEMNAALGGRYVTKFIMPFDFNEYLRYVNFNYDYSTKSQAKLMNYLNDYLTHGGLPASINLVDKNEYISSVYQKLFFNDILLHNEIRNENAMRIIVKKIAETLKDEVSYSKLYNILKSIGMSLSKDTIIDYISYIINSNMIFKVENYYASFVDKESTPKYYFMDNGILNLFIIDKETRLLENAVALYLKRKGYDFYYIKSSKTGIDIDFYVPDTNELIQVAYSIDNLETEKREANNFLKWNDASSRNMIITFNEKRTIELKDKTIDVIPIYELLTK